MVTLTQERSDDAASVLTLHDMVFGPGRFVRSGYLAREGAAPDPKLSIAAWDGDRLVGSIRFTPMVLAGQDPAHAVLLLGPLAVVPERQGNGVGGKLIAAGLEAAREHGHAIVFLLGPPAYYAKYGFSPVPAGQVRLTVPYDPVRLLALRLDGQGIETLKGILRPSQ